MTTPARAPALLTGTLDEFRLEEVLEAVGMSRQTLRVVLRSDADIVLRGGMVLDARKDGNTGRDGFFAIVRDPGPSYEVFASPGFHARPLGPIRTLVAEARSAPAEVAEPPPLFAGTTGDRSLRALLDSLGLSRQILRVELANADRQLLGWLVVRAGALLEAGTASGLEGAAALRALAADPGERFSVRITTSARRQPLGRLVNLLDPGPEVPGYTLGASLGAGGSASVWSAVEDATGDEVAIKIFRQFTGDANALLRELVVSAGLRHPNLVEVRDFGLLANGAPYLVMERMHGRSLADQLLRGPIAPARLLALFRPVLEAMAAIHAAGLVHRDLKPANLWLWDAGGATESLVVLDFGIAARTGADGIPRSYTPAYAAPESIEGGDITPAQDVYQLGVVMAEALAGAPLVTGNVLKSIAAHLGGIQIPAAVRDMPFGPVLVRATRVDPKERYPDAGVMLAALRAVPKS